MAWQKMFVVVALAPLAAVLPANAQERGAVRVTVNLRSSGVTRPGADAVLWLPGEPAPQPPTAAYPALEISQQDKQFHPRVGVVPVGATVSFPNHDRIFHNVFSLSAAKPFDLGLYRNNRTKSVTFDQPGVIQIYCNIHPQMVAYLVVVDAARHGMTAADGSLELADVPAGSQKLEGWHDQGGTFSREVTVPAGGVADVAVNLDVSDWREVPHLNKRGKEYPPPDDDEFRY